jgi:prolyl 4-hydroxylase
MRLHEENFLMVNLNELVQVYHDALEPNICQFLVDLFEQVPDKHERYDNDGKPNFTQFNLTENCKLTPEIERVHNHLIKKTLEYKDKYYEFIDSRVFPKDHAFEQFRIKKYNPGGTDQFDTHVDVIDHATARRFLSFFWYLNDVEVGGHTRFSDMSIEPKHGTLLVFPPLWMFPHKGEPVISGPKYIISTYLHYK